ncbi:MAG: DsbE family thiol:disulfide interchange protein [Hyphomonadaceae bacterium]|nr:MAG: cytochrome c bioproteinis protein CcmG thiol:disulfide interchange protein DsbE [Caulobacteraceae bacterium]MBT9444832.1 DsbE family thiol:disulfide interchange protein [Hyphomonadaceae bacterium]TPW08375.1 MAG: cytochrome c bioproteinis protein CcmG, thiol:disulfide interchange protein DsbE [Alphaproteobacteria bacterium]
MLRWIVFVPVALFAILAVTFGLGLRRDPSAIPSVLIDRPVPAFVLEPVKPGVAPFRQEDLKGKVSLLNVFASWCSACRYEHPTLMALAENNTIPIYGLDWKDEPRACLDYLERSGDPFVSIGGDMSGRAAIDLGVTGAPETFVIDKAGQIRYKHVGPITEDVWRDTIAPLVARLEAET